MTHSPIGLFVAAAALFTGTFAHAATITTPLIDADLSVSGVNGSASDVFQMDAFDTALGTLTGVSLNVDGDATWANITGGGREFRLTMTLNGTPAYSFRRTSSNGAQTLSEVDNLLTGGFSVSDFTAGPLNAELTLSTVTDNASATASLMALSSNQQGISMTYTFDAPNPPPPPPSPALATMPPVAVLFVAGAALAATGLRRRP